MDDKKIERKKEVGDVLLLFSFYFYFLLSLIIAVILSDLFHLAYRFRNIMLNFLPARVSLKQALEVY